MNFLLLFDVVIKTAYAMEDFDSRDLPKLQKVVDKQLGHGKFDGKFLDMYADELYGLGIDYSRAQLEFEVLYYDGVLRLQCGYGPVSYSSKDSRYVKTEVKNLGRDFADNLAGMTFVTDSMLTTRRYKLTNIDANGYKPWEKENNYGRFESKEMTGEKIITEGIDNVDRIYNIVKAIVGNDEIYGREDIEEIIDSINYALGDSKFMKDIADSDIRKAVDELCYFYDCE